MMTLNTGSRHMLRIKRKVVQCSAGVGGLNVTVHMKNDIGHLLCKGIGDWLEGGHKKTK